MFVRRRAVQLHDASLSEPEKLRAAMEGCEAVFLAGAHYPRYSLDLRSSVDEGVSGVRNACEAARAAGVSRFVYTSSIGTLARPGNRPATEDDIPLTAPTDSVYRTVKWAMERELEEHAARGLRTTTLLPGGCIGPWDLRLGTGGVMVALVRGELPFWIDGMVSLVDVGDVALAHVAALGAPTDRYCLAPHTIDFPSLLKLIVSRYGGHIPMRIDLETAKQRSDEAERAAAKRKERVAFPRELVDIVEHGQPIDCTRSERVLGLRYTPLELALDRAHAWFCQYRYLSAQPQQGNACHDQH